MCDVFGHVSSHQSIVEWLASMFHKHACNYCSDRLHKIDPLLLTAHLKNLHCLSMESAITLTSLIT